MKLFKWLSLLGLGAGSVAVAIACSGGTEGGDGDSVQTGKVPPAEQGTPTTASDERTFAIDSLHLGEADRGGVKNPNAWKKYGYNLDGRITNVTDQKSPDLARVCKRSSGAPATIHQDGDEGTDNTFGKEILKLLDPFTPTPSKSLTDAIKKGDFTIMLKVKGLTDQANQTNTGLSGTLLVGGDFGNTPPTFSPADDWPYRAEPQVAINGAYITNGVFVNGKGGAVVDLALSISGQQLKLTINKAIITFTHKPPSDLAEGTIAGVINTEEFVNGIGAVAGRFSTDLCQGSTVEGIKSSIRQASDMMADGTQDPSKECNGISVGIGFTAKRVGNPTKTSPPDTVPPDPCTSPKDGGTDSQPPQDSGAKDASQD
jgi:hypothetical protein